MLIIARTIQTIKHASEGTEGPCPECKDQVFKHPWCAGWSRPTPDKHPKQTLANQSKRISRRATNGAKIALPENRRLPQQPGNLVQPGVTYGCQPRTEARITTDSDGSHTYQQVRIHTPLTCILRQRKKAASQQVSTSEAPDSRDASLPPPLHPYQYHRLLKKGAQLVLATYRREDTAKVPTSKNWQHLRPDFPTVLHHVQSDPNALVGIIPASMGCLLVDVDQGDHVPFTRAHPPVAQAPSRRKGGFHLYYQVPTGTEQTPTGHSIDLMSQHGIRGDVRCRDSFAVIWHPSGVEALLKVASLNEKDICKYPAPLGTLRAAQSPGAGSGFCSYDPAQKQYWGHWWSQASASIRRDRLIKNVRLARQLRLKGAGIAELAETFKKSVPTIYRWLDITLDLQPIPPPWKLMTQRRHSLAVNATPDGVPPTVGRENQISRTPAHDIDQRQTRSYVPPSPSSHTPTTERNDEHDPRPNRQQRPATEPRHQTLGASTKHRRPRASQGTSSKRTSSGIQPREDGRKRTKPPATRPVRNARQKHPVEPRHAGQRRRRRPNGRMRLLQDTRLPHPRCRGHRKRLEQPALHRTPRRSTASQNPSEVPAHSGA